MSEPRRRYDSRFEFPPQPRPSEVRLESVPSVKPNGPRFTASTRRVTAATLLCLWGCGAIYLSARPTPATAASSTTAALLGTGTLEFEIRDATSGKPIAARIVVRDDRGRPKRIASIVRQGTEGYVFYEVTMKLPEGDYTYEIDAGPEYRPLNGSFSLRTNDLHREPIVVERAVDLASEDWAVVEQGVLENREEADVIVAATQARHAGAQCGPFPARRGRRDFAAPSDPAHTWFAWYPLELGNARLALWDPSLDPFDEANSGDAVAWPHDVESLLEWKAADNRRRVLLDSVLADSLPLWAGLEVLDGVGVLTEFDSPDAERVPTTGYDVEPGVARDPEQLLRASIERYQQLLATDVYLPPTALSRWDTDQRPLGMHRTMTAMKIGNRPVAPWDALSDGFTWISSGPLVRFTASRERPGTLFSRPRGQTEKLQLAFSVTSRYPIDHIELHQTGQLVRQFTLRELAQNPEPISVEFSSSGWLLAVAWAGDQEDRRIALAAPFRVDIGGEPYIDPRAVRAQLALLDQLEAEWGTDSSSPARDEHFARARDFWTSRLP
ncbi:MAG: hypothetical protein KDA83_05875 [Planctomycetales bacterium]|nr:hypothetical protein [Planctomycetales bacterium]